MNDDIFEKGSDPNLSTKAADAVRKLFVSGISTVFMTEDGIRNAVGDLRLPKEAIQFLLNQTDNGRREVMRLLSEELKDFLRELDLTSELRKALVGLTLEVSASIKIKETALETEMNSADISAQSPTTEEDTKAKRAQHPTKRAPQKTIQTQ